MSYQRVSMNGHSFEMKDGDVWVNGRRLTEEELEPRSTRRSLGLGAVTVGFAIGVVLGFLLGG